MTRLAQVSRKTFKFFFNYCNEPWLNEQLMVAILAVAMVTAAFQENGEAEARQKRQIRIGIAPGRFGLSIRRPYRYGYYGYPTYPTYPGYPGYQYPYGYPYQYVG